MSDKHILSDIRGQAAGKTPASTEIRPAGRDLVPLGVASDLVDGTWPSLGEIADATIEAEGAAHAENTIGAYGSDWETWTRWAEHYGKTILPAIGEDVGQYLTWLVEFGRDGRPARPRTAARHLAAIAGAHRAAGYAFDTKHPAIDLVQRGLRRKHGTRQVGAPALRTVHVEAICTSTGLDPHGVRNRAIVLLGYAGGFRRSELVGLDVGDVTFRPEGVVVFLEHGKNDQERRGRHIGIHRGKVPATCPVAALQRWWNFAELGLEHDHDPLFRPINRWGQLEYGRLNAKTIDRVVKALARQAGLDTDGHKQFSAHSLRAGHITEAKARKADKAVIRSQTGHSSDAMLDRYDRDLAELFVANSSAFLGL